MFGTIILQMKLKIIYIFIALLYTQLLSKAQDTPDVKTDTAKAELAALTIGAQSFTAAQLNMYYQRAKLIDTSGNLSPNAFVDNFVRTQLLLKRAEKEGRDKALGFKEEVATLKKELAAHFLEDTASKNQLIKEAYSRIAQEVNVSHILVSVQPWASATDTLAAYAKILTLRNRAMSGENFEELAKSFSDDKSAIQNNGNLGYITAFQTLYNFETVAFETPVGAVSMPFRTDFGYHIVKVIAKRPYQRWRTAHIFVAVSKNAETNTAKAAKQKIDEAYSLLKAGQDFGKICKSYSEDPTTVDRGGEFKRLFGSDELEKSFEDALFSLKTNGSYTAPIQTSKGWHIIKLLEKQNLKPYETMYNYLQNKVKTDNRYKKAQKELVENLKKQYQYKEDESTKKMVLHELDSLLSKNMAASINSDMLGFKMLFQIGGRATRCSQFFDFIEKDIAKNKYQYNAELPKYWYQNFEQNIILNYAEDNLEQANNEYALQVAEYKENILLNQVYDEQVWSVSVEDTLKQAEYYQRNKAKYILPERANVEVYDCATSSDLRTARTLLAPGPYNLSLKWRNLQYKKSQSQLDANHEQHLLSLAALLHKNPDYTVEIHGNIDPDEPDSVSANRVYKVEQYLLGKNIKPSRIVVKDNGKYKPLSKTNRLLNSRVEFVLLSQNKEDVLKLYNSLRVNAISYNATNIKRDNSSLAKIINWEPGVQQVSQKNRQLLINIKEITPSKTMSLTEAKGLVIKGLQEELENGILEKMKAEYPVYKYNNELEKLK
jgi:peptidyl-prolyl cis-trans isomerase SurA